MRFGTTEILLILAVLLLLFGATRLPALGSSVGQAIRNFKKGFSGEETPEEKARAAERGGASNPRAEAKPTEQPRS